MQELNTLISILHLAWLLVADGGDSPNSTTIWVAIIGGLFSTMGVALGLINARISRSNERTEKANKDTSEVIVAHDEKLIEYGSTIASLAGELIEVRKLVVKKDGEIAQKDAHIADGHRYEGEAEAHIDEWEQAAPDKKNQLKTKRPVKIRTDWAPQGTLEKRQA